MTARIRIGLTAAALSVVPIAVPALADEPTAPASPDAINQYYESGEFNADVKAVTGKATKSLSSLLKKKPKKPAIVFDIDDTLESTYRCGKKSDFDRSALIVCQAQGDQDPIKPVWALLKAAQKKKVAIIVITGRPQGIETSTREQLKRDGLKGKYTLIMRPNDDSRPAATLKAEQRKALVKKGYGILVNIGDQKSDLAGGSAVKRFKVPNPMYVTP